MSGREDTKLDRLIVNCLAVVYNSNQMVHYSNIAAMCTHQFVPLHYSWVLHTHPLARFIPSTIKPVRFQLSLVQL